MNFLEQSKKGKGSDGTYLLSFAAVFLATILAAVVAEVFALKILGHSLAGKVPEGKSEVLTFAFKLFPYVISLSVLILCVKYLNKRPILSIFTSRERFDWKRFFVSFSIWGGLMMVFLIVALNMGAPIEYQFNAGKFFPLMLVSLVLIPIQTTAEDALFRGYLFQGLGRTLKSGIIAILMLGGIFGYLHAGNPEVELLGQGVLIYYIATGVFMGILSHLDDGLELGMGFHAINNLFGVLILSTDWQVFQTNSLFIDHTPPAFGWDMIISLVIVQPLLIFTFFKIYKWKNVKEKFLN